jgi:hypothetical protein
VAKIANRRGQILDRYHNTKEGRVVERPDPVLSTSIGKRHCTHIPARPKAADLSNSDAGNVHRRSSERSGPGRDAQREHLELYRASLELKLLAEVRCWPKQRKGRAAEQCPTFKARSLHKLRIPIYSGWVFRREAGHRYDLKPSTIPK